MLVALLGQGMRITLSAELFSSAQSLQLLIACLLEVKRM
jgi:hypothetical protein